MAGGFVGTSSGTITNCYCTGLVVAPTDPTENHGAFAGSVESGFSASGCQYFEIINEREDAAAGYTYLGPVNNAEYSGITAFDETAATYQSFSGDPEKWKGAAPYDQTLVTYYHKIIKENEGAENESTKTIPLYNLVTVGQLDSSVSASDFVSTHYGDWPAPEEFVFN